MKAVTIIQPWATLIALGVKTFGDTKLGHKAPRPACYPCRTEGS